MDVDLEGINVMKYAELRKLAKAVGIKANMKADKLVKALQDYAAKQRVDTGRLPTSKIGTPKSQTPLRQKMVAPAVKTPLRNSPLARPATPLSAPRPRPATPKVRTPLHRLRTPPSRRASTSLLTPGGSAAKRTPNAVTAASRKRSRSPVGEASQSAKRQRTTEKSSTLKGSVGRDVTVRRRRSRSNTYDLEEPLKTPEQTVSSPGTTELINSMSQTQTEAERKEKLLAALDKKVQEKLGDSKQTTQIPRFVAFCAKKKLEEQSAKKETPGQQRYQKVHARHFQKMESLEQYLENKKKRTEALTASAQKPSAPSQDTASTLKKLKFLVEESPSSKSADAKMQLFKSPAHNGIPFVPKVTSVSKVNFSFTTKTPGSTVSDRRRSPRLDVSMKDKENKDKAALSARKKSMGSSVTPFKFKANLNQSHNASLNKSAHKAKFDLSASLSRPITWKPHTGKVKPLEPTSVYRKDVKAVKVTTKEERREQTKAHQTKKRQGSQMKRRGLAA